MVLGLKSKHEKGVILKVVYVVHVNEVRPWPPSEAMKSVQNVFLQWENGAESSGTFHSIASNSNIAFNVSFTLPLALFRRKSSNKFQKNYLEFSLFDPRKEKSSKDPHLLGTALLNLADYALFDDLLNIDVPFNIKDNSDGWSPPALSITLQLVGRDISNSSPSISFSKEASSLDNDDGDSGITSLTDYDYDDDVRSSHSSRTAGSSTFEIPIYSPSRKDKNRNAGIDLTKMKKRYSRYLITDASLDTWNKVKDYVSSSKISELRMSYVKKSSASAPLVISSPISVNYSGNMNNGRFGSMLTSHMRESHDAISDNHNINDNDNDHDHDHDNNYSKNNQQNVEDKFVEVFSHGAMLDDEHSEKNDEKSNSSHSLISNAHPASDNGNEECSEDTTKSEITLRSETESLVPDREGQAVPPSGSNKARSKGMKSVQTDVSVEGSVFSAPTKRKETDGVFSDGQNEWKIRAEMVEEELRETAAIEVALYCVVTEHSSSVHKVHAPARRLWRFYNNACRAGSQAKRASAARAAISGLVLVSKACGNDVPRLTFWLSNAIMLRSIVSQTALELPHSNASRQQQSKPIEEPDDWEHVLILIIALEEVESWLFYRIVECVWWKAFMPHMLPTVEKDSNGERRSGTKKTSGRRNYFGDHEQGSFSIELWKTAFRDACERICPIRAAGHECGCLSALVILVMEELVNRLDTVMLNAILRESGEVMSTDPVSDPITDCKVLPVLAGKLSFGAGAQLKNVIGNWSRWLSDRFGLEDESIEDSVIVEDGETPKNFKAFRLLHSLSDLMMLPFEMLADVSTRKQVCPMFGPTIIKRVLSNFVPDEFNPNPIPQYIINALNSEEVSDSSQDLITSFPCTATPTKYSPPHADLLIFEGEVESQVLKSSGLSALKKSYTSDDDLDELDSPLTSVIPDSYRSSSALARLSLMPKDKGGRDVVRYQLLREIWRDDE